MGRLWDLTHGSPSETRPDHNGCGIQAGPDYYRDGDHGLVRVVDGIETLLVEGPVGDVWDDHMGGALMADVTAVDISHLRAGEGMPTPLVRQSGYAHAQFTGLIDGRPSLFYSGIPEAADLDDWPCSDRSLNSRDLLTGEERRHLCLPIEDARWALPPLVAGSSPGLATSSAAARAHPSLSNSGTLRATRSKSPLIRIHQPLAALPASSMR